MTTAQILEIAGKICMKCKIEYPATAEYFYCKSAAKDGLRHRCKMCTAEYCKKYYETDTGKNVIKRYQQADEYKQYRKRYTASVKGHLRNVFASIKQRCIDPDCKAYKWYGGRGIKCLFTSDEFVSYVMDELQIDPRGLDCDRVNNDGNYEPGNIQFITHKENVQKIKRQK